MRKISLVSLVVLALTGCGITPVHFDGKTATYQHLELDFKIAMEQAKELCAKEGKVLGMKGLTVVQSASAHLLV